MLFALLYACMRLFLDVIELRVGGRGVEAEVLLLRLARLRARLTFEVVPETAVPP